MQMTAIRKFLPGSIVADHGLNDRQIRVLASTSGIDRQLDIVDPLGCKLDNYRRNPIVLASHDPKAPIGTSWPEVIDGRLEATITFAPEGVSADADRWCGLAKSGVVRGVSIGFEPIEQTPLPGGGRKFTKWELLELSLCAVPANAEALTIERSYRGRGKSADLSHIDNEADRLAMLMGCLVDGTREGKKAIASHEETREHLDRFGGLLLEGLTHAKALAKAGFLGASDHPFSDDDETGEPEGDTGDEPDVELAAGAAARRTAKLDALDRADVGRIAPRRPAEGRDIGGGYLTASVRAEAQARIWDAYK
jgi:HK97 family phage prohead protease